MILEFSEKQQHFHHNEGRNVPNTNGYFTIEEFCSDEESRIFMCYIDRLKPRNLTLKKVREEYNQLRQFQTNLKEFYGLEIKLTDG